MMNINRINNVDFTGRIIDAHVHVGRWETNGRLRDYTKDIDTFITRPLKNGDKIERMIVSNLDCMQKRLDGEKIEFISDEIKGNTDLLNLAGKNSKIIPLAVCQPGYGSVANIKKLFDTYPNKFFGLKFHPESLKISADNNVYDSYMKFADKKHLPCLFHSGQTFDVQYPGGHIAPATMYAKPEMIYNLAKRHKNVPVIMAHMGGNNIENSKIAVDKVISSIKNADARLYADISWVDCDTPEKPGIIDAIKRLKQEKNGLEHLLFGTDAPLGRFGAEGEKGINPYHAYSQTVDDIKNAIKKEFGTEANDIIDKIFYKNAEKLFLAKHKNISGIKISGILIGSLICVGALAGFSSMKNTQKAIQPEQRVIKA